jgi:plastocyanin
MNAKPVSAPLVFLVMSAAVGAIHCGDDDSDKPQNTGGSANTGGATTITGGSSTSGGAVATGGAANDGGAGDTIPDLNGCTETAYENQTAVSDERAILIAASGLTFTPKCMTIEVGQTVHFQGSLAAHPLAPGNPEDPGAGSADNPIQETSSGQAVDFTFATAGTFPYYCELHAFGAGMGMAGVVHVRP